METIEYNAAATEVSLSIQQTLDATSLERLIHRLAEARERMHPAVPATLHEAAAQDAPALSQNEPSLMFQGLQGGRLRMLVRTTGFGWLAFVLPERDVRALREFVSGEVGHTTRPQ